MIWNQIVAVFHFNEAGRDPKIISDNLNAPLEDIVNVQLLADSVDIETFADE